MLGDIGPVLLKDALARFVFLDLPEDPITGTLECQIKRTQSREQRPSRHDGISGFFRGIVRKFLHGAAGPTRRLKHPQHT